MVTIIIKIIQIIKLVKFILRFQAMDTMVEQLEVHTLEDTLEHMEEHTQTQPVEALPRSGPRDRARASRATDCFYSLRPQNRGVRAR